MACYVHILWSDKVVIMVVFSPFLFNLYVDDLLNEIIHSSYAFSTQFAIF